MFKQRVSPHELNENIDFPQANQFTLIIIINTYIIKIHVYTYTLLYTYEGESNLYLKSAFQQLYMFFFEIITLDI